MDIAQKIILLVLLVGFASTANAIQCYTCLGICSSPFNETHPNVQKLHSPTGWCMKFKASRDLTSTIIRSPDTFGACFENKCKTKVHNQYYGMGCCCNTHLCNKSFPITKSSISLLGVALLASINMILSY